MEDTPSSFFSSTLAEPPDLGSTVSLGTRLSIGARRLVTLVVLLIGGVSLGFIAWLLLQRADAELHARGEEVHLKVSATLDTATLGLADLSQRSLLRNALVDPTGRDTYLRPALTEHRRNHPAIVSLWLMDHLGQPLATSTTSAPTASPRDADIRELASRSVVAGQLQQQLRQREGRWRLILAYPVFFGATNSAEGAVVGELDLDLLLKPPLGAIPSGYRAEVRSGNQLVAATAPSHSNELSVAWPVLLRTRDNGASQAFTLEVFEPTTHALLPVLWVGLLYGLLTAIVLRVARHRVERFARSAIEPLQALKEAARHVTRDGLDEIPQLSADQLRRGGAEVHSLAHSFQTMLRRLQAAHSGLEQTVAHRTEELAQAKERLDSILASLDDGVYSLSIDRQTLLFASPPVYSLLGLPPSATPMVDETMRTLLDEQGRHALAGAISHAMKVGNAVVRLAVPGDDRGPRWLLNRLNIVRDAAGQAVRLDGSLSDITGMVRAEAWREQATAELRLRDRAIDASTNGIVLVDVRRPNAPLVFVNEGFERVTGYHRDEVLGRSCSFLQGDDRDQPGLSVLRAAIEHHTPCRVLLRNYRKDGRRFDNDLSIAPVHHERTGEVTHYIGVISDITEQRAAEALLRDQFARLDTIFALSPDGFVSFDKAGRVVSCNPAFERLTGLSAGEVTGLDVAAFDTRLDACIEQRNPPGMAHWSASDDEQADVLVLRGPPQRVLVCSTRECTAENVSRVLHLRDITRETEVDRMKSEFLSTAAHELRTPMASIRGFSDLLLMRRFDEERTRDLLQTINRQSVWLTNMINELLDLARIEARKGKDFQLASTDVGELMRHIVTAQMVPGDDRRTALHIDPDLPTALVDPAKLQHAVTNVLSNAYKYSPQGGEISMTVRQAERSGRTGIAIVVRDQGIGMSPEHTRRAFERFFRADASGNIPGTGLGLALVKEIVELHGGQVDLDSALGQGTTVTLWLPAESGSATPVSGASEPQETGQA